jgi:hypothetical protein
MNSNRPRPKQVLIVAHDPQNNPIDPMSPPINNPMGLGFRGRRSPSRSGSMDGPVRPSRKFVPCDPNSDDEDDIFVRMQIEVSEHFPCSNYSFASITSEKNCNLHSKL